jgi:alkyl hydroperoxide reductase subunit AhpF
MALLKIYGGQALQVTLNEIVSAVQVTYYALESPEPDTIAALADLQALTPLLSFTVAPASPEAAADRVTVQGASSSELVFLGPPVGTELAALVSAIVVAGRGSSGLSSETQAALTAIEQPIHMEVFTTPT